MLIRNNSFITTISVYAFTYCNIMTSVKGASLFYHILQLVWVYFVNTNIDFHILPD